MINLKIKIHSFSSQKIKIKMEEILLKIEEIHF